MKNWPRWISNPAREETFIAWKKRRGYPRKPRTRSAKTGLDAALFFSPKSAALFAECAARDGLAANRLIAVCISSNTPPLWKS